MVQTGDLIFESGAVALLENRRRNEDKKIALGARIQFFLEEISQHRDVAHDWHLAARLRGCVLQEPTDGEGVAALYEDVRVEGASINDRAGYRCAREIEDRVADFVTDFRFHAQGNEVVFVDRWPHDQRIAKFLVLESAEDCGRR